MADKVDPKTAAEIEADMAAIDGKDEPEAPKEEAKVEAKPVESTPAHFTDCPDCSGSGLKDEHTLCPTCKGDGRVL